jgi:hypothetical protein
VQVRDEGGVRAIVVVILRDRDPLGNGELLFQVKGDALLLLPSEGGDTLVCPGLIQGLACGSHDGNESLLLLVCSSGDDLLLIGGEVGGVAQHDRQDNNGKGWWWWAAVNQGFVTMVSVIVQNQGRDASRIC